jgi:hypothetical protein
VPEVEAHSVLAGAPATNLHGTPFAARLIDFETLAKWKNPRLSLCFSPACIIH